MSHPYEVLPGTAFWRHAITEIEPFRVDPVVAPRFRIARDAPADWKRAQ